MGTKWSKYTIDLESGPDMILVNTVLFSCVKIDKDSALYRCFKEKNTDGLDHKTKHYLEERNFIVDENLDEKEYCDFIRNQYVYSDAYMHVMILPTDACNFRCVYCYESAENSYLDVENEQALLKYFKKKIPKLSGLRLSWFGGEPLVRKNQVLRMTKTLNDLCKKYGVAFSGQITTNGYELDLDTFQQLIQNRILFYQICIDGNEFSHNKQRPHVTDKDSYHRIIENIKNIKNNCASNTFKISLRSNVTEETENYLEAYLQEIYSIVGSDERFEIVFQGVRDWGGRVEANHIEILKEKENSIYEKWYVRAAQIGLNSAEKMDITVYSGVCEGNCSNSFIIFPDCSVHKCTVAYYNQKTRCSGHLGQILPDGRMEIDEAKIMTWMSRSNNCMEKCDDCKLYPDCKGGACPYHTNILGESMATTNHCDCLWAMAIAKIKCMDIKNQIPRLSKEVAAYEIAVG